MSNKIPEQIASDVTPVSMSEMMHNSMIPFAEYVIMDRALPRVEDGLKPVQRRILYTMLELGLTPDKPHRKSARIVGDCLGKYHPHGDSSVYDAMVRMAQDFVMRAPLVSGHGNFGSIDGDSAAAMRYTEARLSPIAMELLAHIEKDTVPFTFNFDDTLKEPTLLPARFPNLLVHGASGIAVGLATNIPPHNLSEVIDGVIARIQNPNLTLDELMQHIPGPDFPTGGYLLGLDGLREAYETGRGKVVIRAKASIEKGSNGKTNIVITEVPYQVNKAAMLSKILTVTEQKKDMFAGISDIRDESDRTGLRAVIEVRKDYDPKKILNCLYKYSDLQVTFGINMVCIADGQPKQLSLMDIIDHYIAFQKDIVTRRTRYDLERAKQREHILAGLIVAVQNIDEVIRIIRGSSSPKEAKARLMSRFALTDIQAQAILDMRLARLTALEIEELRKEYTFILETIRRLEAILASETRLMRVIMNELAEIKENYGDKRRTRILDTSHEVEIDEDEFKSVEECVIILTQNDFLKRVNQKSYQKSSPADGEVVKCIVQSATDRRVQIFTNMGTLFTLPVSDIPECKLRDKGKPLSALLAGIAPGESVAGLFSVSDFDENTHVFFATRGGLIKRTSLAEYDVRNKKITACGLAEGDSIIAVHLISEESDFLVITRGGMAIRFSSSDVPAMGRVAKGVKAVALDKGDSVVMAAPIANDDEVAVFTELGYAKLTYVTEFETQHRGGKGVKAISFFKNGSTGTYVAAAFPVSEPCGVVVTLKSGQTFSLSSEELVRQDRVGRGSSVVLAVLGDIVVSAGKSFLS
ncbi:MAG: DNA gyrase subunit A [Christensenellaceae bacterium]|nr:DNA gyrase subunit A [Christensenellaceae bacterium]